MFIYPIYTRNWMNISTIYIHNKTSIKRNIFTIKQNTSGSRSGLGLISAPCMVSPYRNFAFFAIYLSHMFYIGPNHHHHHHNHHNRRRHRLTKLVAEVLTQENVLSPSSDACPNSGLFPSTPIGLHSTVSRYDTGVL